MKTTIKITLSIFALIVGCGAAVAQRTETLSGIEKAKATSLWFFGSHNAAGLTIDQTVFTNELSVAYDRSAGDFKRPQSGDTETILAFQTEGGRKLNGTYLWGSFSYGNLKKEGAQWNTNLIDPYRDMPFFMADPIWSVWEIQSYTMQAKVSTPFVLKERLAFGFDVAYQSQYGEKTIYPKASNRVRSIDIKPGIIYRLTPSLYIGVSGEYLDLNEDNIPTVFNNAPHNVQMMRGLGFSFLKFIGTFGLMSTNFIKELWGGELQVGFQSKTMQGLLAAGYRKSNDSHIFAQQTILNGSGDNYTWLKEDGGRLLSDEFYLHIGATHQRNGNVHVVKADMNLKNRKGIENKEEMWSPDEEEIFGSYVTLYRSVRSTYDRLSIGAAYDYFRGHTENDYLWRAGLFFNYNSNQDDYIMPVGIQHFNAVDIGVQAKYNWALNPKYNMLIGLNVMNHTNLNKEFAYEGPEPDAPKIVEFVIPDFEYRTTNYFTVGGSVAFSVQIKKIGSYIGADVAYLHGGSALTRTLFNVKLGIYF